MRKYNSKFEYVLGKKVCYYCGKPLKEYEDRIGCDYREDGEFYNYCDCEASYEEEKFEQEKLKYIRHYNKLLEEQIKELEEKYADKLKKNYDLDELRYNMELDELNKRFKK